MNTALFHRITFLGHIFRSSKSLPSHEQRICKIEGQVGVFSFARAAIDVGKAILQSQIGKFSTPDSNAGSSGKHELQLFHKLDNRHKAYQISIMMKIQRPSCTCSVTWSNSWWIWMGCEVSLLTVLNLRNESVGPRRTVRRSGHCDVGIDLPPITRPSKWRNGPKDCSNLLQ